MKILIIIGTLFIFSCGKNLNRLQKLEGAGVGIDSSSPKSCICTMNYDPVCGADNINYDNSCLANCKGVSFQNGLCAGQKLACNPNSGLVCGQLPMPTCPTGMLCTLAMQAPQTFSDECTMQKNGATLISKGACKQFGSLCNSNSGLICAQPPMQKCPKGKLCSMVMPASRTYQSDCHRYDAKAKFLHKGKCSQIVSRNCTQVYKPVCGQLPMPKCEKNKKCLAQMPRSKTYSNICYMKLSRAIFVSNGKCR